MAEPFGERRLKQHPTYLTYLKQLETIISDAIARGEVRDADVGRLAISVAAVVREIILNRIVDRDPPPIEDDVRFAVDFVMRAVEKRI